MEQTKKHLIFVEGEFCEQTVKNFKEALKKCELNSEIHVRIKSKGGNLEILHRMRGLMYFVTKYKKCTFIAEIIHAESAALLFAIVMHQRHVISSSTGEIHLPETRRGGTDEAQKVLQDYFVDLYVRNTKLTRSGVAALNQLTLRCDDMMGDGISTKKVEKFIVLPD